MSHDPKPKQRVRVLTLGGGIGAARKLKKADVDVMLVDKHDSAMGVSKRRLHSPISRSFP